MKDLDESIGRNHLVVFEMALQKHSKRSKAFQLTSSHPNDEQELRWTSSYEKERASRHVGATDEINQVLSVGNHPGETRGD